MSSYKNSSANSAYSQYGGNYQMQPSYGQWSMQQNPFVMMGQ